MILLIAQSVDEAGMDNSTIADVLNGYLYVFVIAFIITVLIVPLIRRFALRSGVVDWPDDARKAHREPVPYLGGVAVFIGLIAGIIASYFFDGYQAGLEVVPPTVVAGLALIMLTGLIDDVYHLDPRLKIGGQLIAAAVLAFDPQIGENIAAGLLNPFKQPICHLFDLNSEVFDFDFAIIPGYLHFDLVYWTGTAIIAVIVIGGCNAANLIDGLDGLLTGTTAIMATALLIISAKLAIDNYGALTGARVVLCYALLGASLGFLPHNFKSATIFLGDAGSLLMGFSIIVIILMLGEEGRTHYVFAGLVVFGLPIMDTVLAILRRKIRKQPISAPDNSHIHHMLKRTRLRTIGAVFVMYAITIVFASLAIIMVFMLRARVVYAILLILASFIVVIGSKAAGRNQRKAEIDKIKANNIDAP